ALGHAGHRHPGRCLSGAGALEDVADVVVTVLHGSGKVGGAGPRAAEDFGRGAGGGGAHRHGVLPVLPIPIADREGDGTAEGESPPDSSGDVSLVLLDLHAAASPVAALATGEVGVDVCTGE